MDDLFYCIRIMQISTDKLQSTRNTESLRRSALIRSTFIQSQNEENRAKTLVRQRTIMSQKRKSCHVDAVKRLCLTSSSTSSSSNVSNKIKSD
ncbi:unnamed protein product [Rotaria magnacalcarata]